MIPMDSVVYRKVLNTTFEMKTMKKNKNLLPLYVPVRMEVENQLYLKQYAASYGL